MRTLCFGALALAVLTACPETGLVCRAGTTKCGVGCADLKSDERACGACGVACSALQTCQDSACVCQAGTTSCGGSCVVTASDPNNCGACGTVCGAGKLCQSGSCVDDCQAGAFIKCGSACVDFRSDRQNCGACGVVCEGAQSCRSGRCSFDLVLACSESGQVLGLQASTDFTGPLEALGTKPEKLATLDDALLSLDAIDRTLYQARLASVGGHAFAPFAARSRVGSVPNHLVVSGSFVYVVNAESATLQVLQRQASGVLPPADSGAVASPGDGGVTLVTVAELAFGPNTSPESIAMVGSTLWIPLFGGLGSTAGAGQQVAIVDVSNPLAPVSIGTVSLASVNLMAFDGGAPVARPWFSVAHGGSVYVALDNLNPTTATPEGPGLLAKINPSTRAVSVINLGADRCLNPQTMVSDGRKLFVSCAGLTRRPPDVATLTTTQAGLVMLDENDAVQAFWSSDCADAGASCTPVTPGRFAYANGRLYLGEKTAGRLFVLDVSDAGFAERRGYRGDAGAAIQACPLASVSSAAVVSDVITVP